MISSGVRPCLYHPTIRRTVTPVPATRGRPPRISSERTINDPMSVTVVMVTSRPIVLRPCFPAFPAQRGERGGSVQHLPADTLPHILPCLLLNPLPRWAPDEVPGPGIV